MPNDVALLIGVSIAGLVVGFLIAYLFFRTRQTDHQELTRLRELIEAKDARIASLERNLQERTVREKQAIAKLQEAFEEAYSERRIDEEALIER